MTPGRWIFAAACSLLLSLEAGAAALYYIGAEAGETMPLKWVTGIDVGYDNPVVGSMTSVWMRSDAQSALAWVASIREREYPPGLIEAWLTASIHESRFVSVERIQRDRGRARNGIGPPLPERPDGPLEPDEFEEMLEPDPDVLAVPDRIERVGETRWGSDFNLPVLPIPEPSSALLVAVGAVAFVLRQR